MQKTCIRFLLYYFHNTLTLLLLSYTNAAGKSSILLLNIFIKQLAILPKNLLRIYIKLPRLNLLVIVLLRFEKLHETALVTIFNFEK